MLATDWAQNDFFAQSQTNIRMSRGTDSLRVVSQGLSPPFLKTFAAVFPDPTDGQWRGR